MIEFGPALSHEGKIERCICCESKSVVRRLNFWRPKERAEYERLKAKFEGDKA